MAAPFLVAQISDPHIGADWGGSDPVGGLLAVLDAVFALPDHPDALLVTGDLVEHGTDEGYERLRDLLHARPAPLYVLGGNHDRREGLRAHFTPAGGAGDIAAPVQYSADLGPLRLVTLDTTIPGRAAGELDGERLAWLDAELALAPAQPTLLAMHHPPVSTGMAPWDAIGLAADGRARLEEVVARHPQVQRLVAGHVHQPLLSTLAGRAVLAIPSTYVQAELDFSAPDIRFGAGPPGFAVHALIDGTITSCLHTVGSP
jgi:3',5'-cyclic AMP phosphodiesterase CpdA